jgi:uncharacterized protein
MRVEKHGTRLVRVRPAPELPAWRDDPAAMHTPLARYAPRDPAEAAYTLVDVTIEGGEVPIGGTLSVPKAGAPTHPGVLFLGGSGRHDRHGMAGEIDLGSHEIVDHLSGHGFVGLRIDKRGAGTTSVGPDPMTPSLDRIVGDAQRAFDYLRARPEVAAQPLFLVGHSEGGTVALILATEGAVDVAGVVLLASGGLPMDEIVLAQTAEVGRQRGASEEQIAAQLDDARRFLELVRSGRDFRPDEVPDALYLGASRVRWLREHLRRRSDDLVGQLRCPLLILHGTKDFQVPVSHGAHLADRAAAAGVAVTFAPLDGLDHLFKPIEGESTLETYYTDRRVDPGMLARLTGWLQEHGGRR